MSRKLRVQSFVWAAFAICLMARLSYAQPSAEKQVLRLPVRVHLVTSESVPVLNCSFSDDDIRRIFMEVNKIWEQADVTWEIESIVRTPAVANVEERYQAVVKLSKGDRASVDSSHQGAVLRGFFSTKPKLENGWNVYIAEDFGKLVGGQYQGLSQSVIFAKFGLKGEQEPMILAHELGHALGLRHVEERLIENLMMTASKFRSTETSTLLTPQQIASARRQARLGKPYVISVRADRIFAFNDQNKDDFVTKDEARRVFLANFTTYDLNKDGKVELIELQNSLDKTVLPPRPQVTPEIHAAKVKEQFAANDKNKDGVVTRDEALLGFLRFFDGYDVNDDGRVELKEFEIALTKPRPKIERKSLFELKDTDGDGLIRISEVEGELASRFDSFDINQDGLLTSGEYEVGQSKVGEQRQFDQNDKDSNGIVGKDEAAFAFWNAFGSFDVNEDEAIDRSEYEEGLDERRFERLVGNLRSSFDSLDEDSDGQVAKSEANDKFWEEHSEFDADENGAISYAEFQLSRDTRYHRRAQADLGQRLMGIASTTPRSGPGLLIYLVIEGTPAEKAGIKVRDRLLRIHGKPAMNAGNVRELVKNGSKTLTVDLLREDEVVQVTVEFAK